MDIQVKNRISHTEKSTATTRNTHIYNKYPSCLSQIGSQTNILPVLVKRILEIPSQHKKHLLLDGYFSCSSQIRISLTWKTTATRNIYIYNKYPFCLIQMGSNQGNHTEGTLLSKIKKYKYKRHPAVTLPNQCGISPFKI